MKKKAYAIVLALVVVWTGAVLILSVPYAAKSADKYKVVCAGAFKLAEYQWAVDAFPYDANVGQIESAETAAERALSVWAKAFFGIYNKPYEYDKDRAIEVLYDIENDCWFVHGTLPRWFVGGVPNSIIRSDGNVLAVWHDL